MNTNFKVVFNKARGALMVANEITSSVQAKGTKTVVAAAVAAVMAGVAGTAMAADGDAGATVDPAASVVIEGTLNVAAKETTTVYSSDGTVTVTADDKTTHAWGEKDTLDSGSSVALKGGNLSVTTDLTVNDLQNGATGTLVIDQAVLTEETGATADRTFGKLDVNFTVHNSKTADAGKNATLTLSGADTLKTTFTEGTMKVVADDKSDGDKALGVATLSSTGALQFGVASEKATGGTVTDQGKAYNFDVKAKAEVSGKSVDYQQGTLTNAADFTMTGETVTIGEDVAFANTGVLRLTSTGKNQNDAVTLNAAYNATDAANSGGKLIISGAAVLGGDVTAKSIKIGAENADLTKETSDVILTNGGVISAGKTVDTDALTFASTDTLTVNGTLVSDKTTVALKGTGLTVDETAGQKTPATASLGEVVVEAAAKQGEVNTFTLTNNTDAAVTATSLTVKPTVTEGTAAYAGMFTLASGAFSVGTLNVGASGSVALQSDSTLTVNASGASTNNGTINLGSAGKMVVAAGVELTNGKDAVINIGTK